MWVHFFLVFSGVKIGFRKISIKSYPFGRCEERHKPYSFQVLLRPQERDVIVDSESFKERWIPEFISQNQSWI